MIKYAFALLLSISVLRAQSEDQISTEARVGGIFEIGKSETNKYKHIDIPRANFIIKRGGIANYGRVEGSKVVVTSVNEKKDGTKEVKIMRKDSRRFFGSHAVLSVYYRSALESGELLVK